MYASHFGLNEDPFKISPNLRFVYRGRNFHAAFRALRAGLLGQRRVMLLESAPGLGKTALLKLLAEELRERGIEASPEACRSWSAAEVLLRRAAGPVLFLDEAQHLADKEVVELLAAAASVKLVFAASPEFAPRLAGADVLRRRLRPLPRREAAAYIRERLVAAGNADDEVFTPDALALVATASGGVPRLINRICSTSLFMASMAQESVIDATRIAETLGTLGVEGPTNPRLLPPRRLTKKAAPAPVLQAPPKPAAPPPTPVLVAERRMAADPRFAFEAPDRRVRRRLPGGALGVATAAATGSGLALLMLMLAPGMPPISSPNVSFERAEAPAPTAGESAEAVTAMLAPETPLPPPTAPAPRTEPERLAGVPAPPVATSSRPAERSALAPGREDGSSPAQQAFVAEPKPLPPSAEQANRSEAAPHPATDTAPSEDAAPPAQEIAAAEPDAPAELPATASIQEPERIETARSEEVAPPAQETVAAEPEAPAELPATASVQEPERIETARAEEAARPAQETVAVEPEAPAELPATAPVQEPERIETARDEEAARPAEEAVVAMSQPPAQSPAPPAQDTEETGDARQQAGAARDEETASPTEQAVASTPEPIVRNEEPRGERQTAALAAPPPPEAALDPLARAVERAQRQVASGRLVEPPGDNALESYRAALALEPWNEEVRRGLDDIAARQVRLAETAETRGDWIGAVEHLETAREIAPDLPAVRALEESRRLAAAAVGPQEPARPAAAEPATAEPVAVARRTPAPAVSPPRRLTTARPPLARPAAPASRPAALRAQPTGPLDVTLLDSAERVRAAIIQGADPNTAYAELRRPLTIAAQRRRPDVVSVLLRNGADPNVQTRDSATPLMYAAWNGDLVTATFLLEAGARTDVENLDGKTPLMAAATRGHAAVAELLLRNGADVDAQNLRGWTALMYAAWSGHRDVVKLLLAQGADSTIRNSEGNTAAALAEMGERPALARLMETPTRSN